MSAHFKVYIFKKCPGNPFGRKIGDHFGVDVKRNADHFGGCTAHWVQFLGCTNNQIILPIVIIIIIIIIIIF